MGVDVRRNLIYFIYYDGNVNYYHSLNLSLLNRYYDVFNGQVIVNVAIDSKCSLEPLKKLLPKGCDIEIVANNRRYGESVHFLDSIKRIEDGITFYAHCKGVSRKRMKGLDIWVQNLYQRNLETIPDLKDKVFSGICAKLLSCPPFVPQDFHYSGSFYWFNQSEIKKRLKPLPLDKYLTERFPALMATRDECIFNFPVSNRNVNFYNESTWNDNADILL